MKHQWLLGVLGSVLLAGCASTQNQTLDHTTSHAGAAEPDQNVLTGGPITGTTVKDLPECVKAAVKERLPEAEIADIDKMTRDGQVVYRFAFVRSNKNARLFLTEDGKVWRDEAPTVRTNETAASR